MDRVERLVVQVDESNRLLAAGGPPRWRIALMLLDNTAELLLKFQCDALLTTNHMIRALLAGIERNIANGETYVTPMPFDVPGTPPRLLTDYRDELKLRVVDDDELHRINGQFEDKLTYLLRNKSLDTQYVTVLRRLHRYRNEAYHEDKIRPETLEEAAKIYTYIVCSLMRTTHPSWVKSSVPTPDLDAIFPPPPGGRPIAFQFTEQYADELLARSPVGKPELLAATLSTHLIDRLDRLDSDLDFIATRGSVSPQDEATREAALLHVLDFYNDFAKSETPPKKQLKTTYRNLKEWRGGATKLATYTQYVQAFDRFTSLEVAIEQVEQVCTQVVMVIDRMIEEEIDRRRGK